METWYDVLCFFIILVKQWRKLLDPEVDGPKGNRLENPADRVNGPKGNRLENPADRIVGQNGGHRRDGTDETSTRMVGGAIQTSGTPGTPRTISGRIICSQQSGKRGIGGESRAKRPSP